MRRLAPPPTRRSALAPTRWPKRAVPVAFPKVKIQFSHRNSNAPLWRMPNCPALLMASTGTMAARLGALVMPMACCVAPEYDVPTVPTLPFDHGCSAIHFSRSAPSGPSSRIGRHLPSDRYRPRTSWSNDRIATRDEVLRQHRPRRCPCCRPSARRWSETDRASLPPRPGTYTSVARLTPSRAATMTLRVATIS